MSELLHAAREDEMTQVIHRAHLFTLEPPLTLRGNARATVTLVLHTGRPVPGLRVDVLHLESLSTDLNRERSEDAQQRIIAAIADLQSRGADLSVRAVAAAARAHKRTVAKMLGSAVHTHKRDLSIGVHRPPQIEPLPSSPLPHEAAPDGEQRCLGGCGKRLPQGNNKCWGCAERAAIEWKQRRPRPHELQTR